ncbi:MAG: hypothetical protein CL946_00040 [Ectothiorhodospiraceae bacterium]|nr:hypothetical protein [Ectothiorhodospiraceae bacterium]
MIRTFIIIALTGLVLASPSVLSQTNKAGQKSSSGKETVDQVTVYYFHVTRRCATCLEIEKTAKTYVESKYQGGKQVAFKTVNVDEDKNQALAEKYQAAGSMLLVVRGEKVEDITTDAFKYAYTKPAKLETRLKKAIAAVTN